MIPRVHQSFTPSRTALAILLASLILAALLATLTVRNIKREQRLMEDFLREEGLTLIQTLEAGARTSLMHHMQGDRPLLTLVRETEKTDSVAYVRIIDQQGRLIAGAGDWPQADNRPAVAEILAQAEAQTTLVGTGLFEVAAVFTPLGVQYGGMPMMMQRRWQQWCRPGLPPENDVETGRQVIYVGFHTRDFDQARQEDVRHSLIMGGILFLVGFAGLYFLFLNQEMRVSRATLATMKLYTESVIESMPAGLITLDPGGRIVSCNSRAEELAGWSAAALHNKVLTEVFPTWPADLFAHRQTRLDIPLDCQLAGGEQVPLKVSASILRSQEGKDLGTVLILRDMRDIRLMEEQLERSRRLAALGQMAAGIAHEIRNPLGTLRGFAQYFRNQAGDDQDGRQYAELMISEVDRLNYTISALLQFARPRQPEVQEVDACDLLQRAGRLLEHDLANAELQLQTRCQSDLRLRADPDLLIQVLINLAQNSLTATPAGGTIELGAEPVADGVRLWVRDTGAGMGQEEQRKMFDPFFTTKKSGTGLGLAVSHQIVEQHQGRFEVSSAPGQGTRIDIILPGPDKEMTDDR